MKVIIWLSVVLWTGILQAQGIVFSEKSWEQVKTMATEQGKLIFLDGTASWCRPCKQMEKEVFTLDDVASHFNGHFINIRMDLEEGMGPLFAARYGVQQFPSLLFLSPDETLIYKVEGFQNSQSLISHAQVAMDPKTINKAFDIRFDEGDRKPDFLHDYAYHRHKLMDGSHQEIVDAYLETQPDWSTEDNLQFVYHFTEEYASSLFSFLVNHKPDFYRTIGVAEVDQTIDFIVHNHITNRGLTNEDHELTEIFRHAYPENYSRALFDHRHRHLIRDQAYIQYADELTAYWQKHPTTDHRWLHQEANRFSQWFSQQERIAQAAGFVQQALAVHTDASYFQTQIDLLQKLGDRRNVKKAKKRYKRYLRRS